MRGLLVEPLGRPRFFTPSGDTPGTEFNGFNLAGENGPEEPCPITGDVAAAHAGTNASDMDPSGPYFLGLPRFFLATGSPMPGGAMEPLPPVTAVEDMLGPWAAPCGWEDGGAAEEVTGANTGVPSAVCAMRTLCMAADGGGPGTCGGGLFGMPNRSLPAISPCSDPTSMAEQQPFLGLELEAAIFNHRRELTSAQVRTILWILNLQEPPKKNPSVHKYEIFLATNTQIHHRRKFLEAMEGGNR
jgi:hypothetical protein